ncbi:hypothetical protein GCM10027415_31030 [Humibacter ginsengisoli]
MVECCRYAVDVVVEEVGIDIECHGARVAEHSLYGLHIGSGGDCKRRGRVLQCAWNRVVPDCAKNDTPIRNKASSNHPLADTARTWCDELLGRLLLVRDPEYQVPDELVGD